MPYHKRFDDAKSTRRFDDIVIGTDDDDLDGFVINTKSKKEKNRKPITVLDAKENTTKIRESLRSASKSREFEEESEDDSEAVFVKHPHSAKERKLLEKGGAPRSAFLRAGSKINLNLSVQPITADLSKTKVRKISASKQIKAFEKLHENPLWGSYLYVISSYPSDLRANQIALSLMSHATNQYYTKKNANKILLKRTPPVWHNVLGGFRDKFLDRDVLTGTPAMMIISNVTEDSSQTKLEKLRDLLVTYDNIPIVVVTSAIDPVTFMLGKLRHHGDGFLYIGPDDRDTINI